ncbi:MAG: PilX N-terminal domain-containing pilus assembly protein [Pseudomonadota bacterium]
MKTLQYLHTPHTQKGAVLITSLIILLVLTIITVSGMQSTIMQEKMTSAVRDSNIALESAESALREGEEFLEGLVNSSGFTGDTTSPNGLYVTGGAPDIYNAATWAGTNSVEVSDKIPDVMEQPRFFIEFLGTIDDGSADSINITTYGSGVGAGNVSGFRIVARGTGKSGTSQRILTSFYGKRF